MTKINTSLKAAKSIATAQLEARKEAKFTGTERSARDSEDSFGGNAAAAAFSIIGLPILGAAAIAKALFGGKSLDQQALDLFWGDR